MGDFRFQFTAKFSMGDFEDRCDMILSYSEDEGIDRSVREWLENCFDQGCVGIKMSISEGIRQMEADQQERHEREELKRLQAKYGSIFQEGD